MGSLQLLDWVIVAGYFILIGVIAWRVIKQREDTTTDYFLAGRHLGWFIVGASIFASNIGSEHLVGLAGSGATDGVAMAHYELHAWCLLVLGWVMAPFYMRSKVFTMPEFLERRFSPTARTVLSVISLVAYVLTKIAVGIFAGGIVFSVLLPEVNFMGLDSFWIGSILVIVLTGLYTILGGLRAVAYTEAMQTIVLVFGSILVTYFGLVKLGGAHASKEEIGLVLLILLYLILIVCVFKALFRTKKTLFIISFGLLTILFAVAFRTLLSALHNVESAGILAGWNELRNICGSEMFNLWKPLVPSGMEGTWAPVKEAGRMAWYFNDNYPWLGMLFCAPIIGLWYWCTDQYIVQRALGSPNEREARRGTIAAAFFKLLPVFIFIIPGMICFALASGEGFGTQASRVISETLIQDGVLVRDEAQKAFPLLVAYILPPGVRGIVVAGLLAALMSSLAGVFNASSTLFTMDFYSRLRPNSTQHQLVWIGRIATAVMVLIGLLWIPVIQGGRGLYDYLQGVQSYLAPPIFVVFFFGVFMKRLNSKGCLASLITGFIMGLIRLGIDTPVALLRDFEYQHGSFFWVMNHVFFQYYSLLIFIVCAIVMVAVSYMSQEPAYEKISGLTFSTLTDRDRKESRLSWNATDIITSGTVIALIVAAYLFFTG